MPCTIINIPVHSHLQRTIIYEVNLLPHDSPFHQKLTGMEMIICALSITQCRYQPFFIINHNLYIRKPSQKVTNFQTYRIIKF